MTIRWQLFPKSLVPPAHLTDVVAKFAAVEAQIETPKNQLSSNAALEIVRPGLEALGFEVERPGPPRKTVRRPVLFGRNGKAAKSFRVDGFCDATGTVIEVEAGRGVVNHQFLKDLFEACAIQTARFAVIAVMNGYKPKSFDAPSDNFETVTTFLDTLYASERLKLPLAGVLVIGY